MERKSELFECSKCHKILGYQRNLKDHEKVCSRSENEKGIKCPDSNRGQFLASSKLLENHVTDHHKIHLREEKYHFSHANGELPMKFSLFFVIIEQFLGFNETMNIFF